MIFQLLGFSRRIVGNSTYYNHIGVFCQVNNHGPCAVTQFGSVANIATGIITPKTATQGLARRLDVAQQSRLRR
ncbi:MAG: hypothetical protein ACRCUI_08015, partial [Polymorphobacter sp.]